MIINTANNPDMQRVEYWFQYAHELCATHKCEDCPLVGYQSIQTDVSILRCETGRGRKPKGQ